MPIVNCERFGLVAKGPSPAPLPLKLLFLSSLSSNSYGLAEPVDRDPIVGIWHAPSNFFGDSITAILQFQPDGTLTSRDSIDYGSGGSGEYYGGNQGVWERPSASNDSNENRT
uniref:Uncharacterized protein n=1 Tax=Pseudictyota dubia TaxID=2749911 RepID=A0A7R9Z0P3_9STRA|mmetsp:Transcript_16492/g.31060  ORF Transcript_16492/g.31060 Transcript_16492/m.31060 type:complete len:113 (+) Transcript_16492:49-387(+)